MNINLAQYVVGVLPFLTNFGVKYSRDKEDIKYIDFILVHLKL